MEDLTPKSCSLRFLAGLSYFVRFSSVAWEWTPVLDPADAVHGPRRQVFLSLVDGFLYYYYYY
jgi:hypothetical protein